MGIKPRLKDRLDKVKVNLTHRDQRSEGRIRTVFSSSSVDKLRLMVMSFPAYSTLSMKSKPPCEEKYALHDALKKSMF